MPNTTADVFYMPTSRGLDSDFPTSSLARFQFFGSTALILSNEQLYKHIYIYTKWQSL